MAFRETSRGVSNDLPKQSESEVAHVRPHGRNAQDKLPLPDGRMMTKQCFWLNHGYLERQIREGDPWLGTFSRSEKTRTR